MKGWKNTLILVLVCAGLGLYVHFNERGAVPEKGKVIARFDPKDVAKVELKSENLGESLTLVPANQEATEWKITAPIETRADDTAADSIINGFKQLVSTHILKDQKNTETYGLKNPRGTATIHLRKGKKIHVVFGKATLDSSNVYAMKQGDSRVLVVASSTYDNFNKSLDDLRNKEVIDLKKESVTKFTIARKAAKLTFEKMGDGWKLTEPIETPADKTEVDTLLGKVVPLTADKFVDDAPKDIGKYSLKHPWVQVDLWAAGKKRATSLFIGKKSADDTGKVYAMTSMDKPVFLLADTLLSDLRKGPSQVRQKQLADIEKDNVTKFVLTNKRGTFGVEKAGKDWKLFQPKTAAADSGAVDSVLWDVDDLKADEFIDKPQPLKVYGLHQPQMQIAVSEGSTTTTIQVGRKKGDDSGVFAKVDGRDTVYIVAVDVLKDFDKSLKDLLDKTVVKFEREDLKKLTIRRDGKPLVIEHTGKDKWMITSPKKVEADGGKLSTILYDIENMTADTIAGELPTQDVRRAKSLAFYGLDKPSIQVDVELKQGKPITVLLGKRTQSGDKVYGMRKDDSTVYTKSDYLLTDLQKSVDDLKK
ncbi:MAG: hypothetical protein AUJ92_06735 [Armatimonadetes bacterium CG2_30_59_28]|nr:DUF4340 domain-containing protein [Armatimonadota bacterium]OIO96097.1 MAG: hypothetical protein AUJ92_06735 [Armatimonadetes bacterium CG2_30_59_28]PIU65567.1 MAG: hypothetical protein COS85_08265 [Armatimonadetes bacterium CG07_land_8_20_14_0_80_59_28]PIX39953.1 MAG: hypothetical protein COZ56_16055 [Armatimonadetes bacterium CG_4_8_14_3_um_filter_58_9]PIY44275.1 MAG: hypothetical protein COZ05_08625 [Armatimonadetes bacterium CG_4_10_14_3_um_filter_59_10]